MATSNDDQLFKENYLKSEIGDEIDSFNDYCFINYNFKYDQIKYWNIEDLKKMVEDYRLNCKDGNKVKNDILKIDTMERMKNNSIIINCKFLNPSQLNNIKPNVSISNPTIVEGGIFQSNYIIYDIKVEQLNWFVKRRFSDFDNLNILLHKFFPGYCIPPLPDKKIGFRRFDDDYIKKRMNFLKKFIDSIMISETFKAHEATVNFFSITDRDIFDKKTKELLTKNENLYVDDYLSINGELNLSYDENNDDIFDKMKKFNDFIQKIISNIDDSSKKFDESIRSAYLNLDNIQKNFNYLSTLYTKIKAKENYCQMFSEMEEFIKKWKKLMYKQMSSFRISIKDSLKYSQLENKIFDNLIENRDIMKKRYEDEKLNLENRKEKLWINGDILKWDLSEIIKEDEKAEMIKNKELALKNMCYKDTNYVGELKKKVGFLNYQVNYEFKNLLLNQFDKNKFSFQKFLDDFYPTITESITIWTNFNMTLSIL